MKVEIEKQARRPYRMGPVLGAFLAGSLVGGIATGIAFADQKHMHNAKHHLEQARDELNKADDDKGGHRGRAIDIIRTAIDEVQRGIDFDRRHEGR